MKSLRTIHNTISFEYRRKLFYVLSASCLLMLGVYVAAVMMTVHHTVARANLQKQVATLTAQTSQLEFTDIALKNNVTLDMAIAQGFAEVTQPVFITRTSGPSLTER